MALIEEKSSQNYSIQNSELTTPKTYTIVSTEVKKEFDRYKSAEVEKIYLHLECKDGKEKFFPIQNESNLQRMVWNFGEETSNWNRKEITLYTTKIDIKGQLKSVIRVQYNLKDKIKT
ncbi:MAG TPA: hypothetical protein PLP33_25965 [Leptospiraceae bacterium]|nr:hypothetical protein [Leptospiraceae bacterium]